jgi:hypothetical protein
MDTRWKTRLGAAGLAAAIALAADAQAMIPEIGTDCETCQFPTAVRMPLCSGVYVGGGIVLTAAHCLDNVSEGQSRARFGEDSSNATHDPIIEYCVAHPDGESTGGAFGASYEGVDLAYCVLDDSEGLPNVPIVPPMVPTGCDRDWLAHQVYETGSSPTVTVVGSGCAEYVGPLEDCGDGIKRYMPLQLVQQTTYNGSSTKLELERWGDIETGIMDGDSGGPVFEVLPDGSWRLLGVAHGTNAALKAAFYEAVPPYLHWIEADSGVDITPCHSFSNGAWSFHGACAGELPLDTNLGGASWASSCPSDLGGGVYGLLQCFDNLPPGDKAVEAPDPFRIGAGVFLPAADFVLGQPPARRRGAASELIAELSPLAYFPFLAQDTKGTVPLAWLAKPAKIKKAVRDLGSLRR